MTFRIRLGRPIRAITVVGLVAAGLVAGPLTGIAHASSTFVVNTAGNASDTFIDGNCDTSGTAGLQCTLRAAIQEANGAAGLDTIQFALASPYRVTLTATGLPAITSPVLIDGTSLAGYSPSTGVIIRVDGVSNTTGLQYGLDFQSGSSGSTVKGLEIDRFSTAGVRLQSDTNIVSGNFIGTTAGSTVNCAAGVSCSTNVGVVIQDGSSNVVGGTTTADRNVLSNNVYGVQITTTTGTANGNKVQGNYIGTNVAGTVALPNSDGVYIDNEGGSDPAATLIGGTAAGSGNVISGNNSNGVEITAGGATVAGNFVGLNAAGSAALPNNGTAGVYVYGPNSSVTVGGPTAASRNILSGNGQEGVEVSGPTLPFTVQNNYIGTDPTGTSAIPNNYDGGYLAYTDGLTVSSNVIAGNNVFGGEDLRVDGGNDALISNNIVGLAANGTTPLADPGSGIALNSTVGTTIDSNIIGNHTSYGLYASSTDSIVVTHNKIGTDSSGTLDRGNGEGVYLGNTNESTIGKPGAGNLISGSTAYGIHSDSSADGTIQGNLIGTDASGTSVIANGATGVWLNSSSRMTVGGTAAGAGNVIVASGVGCCEAGIYLGNSSANTILGNKVGVGSTGGALPNNWVGVYVDGNSDSNQIGSTATGGGNVIANNADSGVAVAGNGLNNSIRGNSIHDNGLLGIDLNEDGLTANDLGDPDFGGNRLQNFPVLSTSASNASGTQVSGTLNSRANRQYALDFYANTSCDGSGNGEGGTYLGSSTVTTNGSGNATFQATLPVSAAAGSQVTATATDSLLGDTSEFSACLANQGGLPAASVANTSASENAGNMTFTVSLSSAPVFAPVTVQYATADGTATNPADYTSTSGTVTFNVGETTKPVNVPIVNDTVDEANETFTLTLSNPTNATIASGQGTATGTINDDDAAPTVSINHAPNVTEGDAGSLNQTFTVTLSAASSLPVTVIADTVTGTATEGVDFVAKAAQLSFAPGETSKQFTVAVLGDTLDENTETYTVQLLSPTNATLGTATNGATILDNDPPPNLSIGDVTATEGNSGKKKFAFTLTLSTVTAKNVHVVLNTANGSATAPVDYGPKSNFVAAIAAGSTTGTFIVNVNGDTTVESDETFFANIDTGQTTNATVIDSQGIGTIQNDD